jgi:ubiquinone/menaquinone biosynthesis C-methylase UbiE
MGARTVTNREAANDVARFVSVTHGLRQVDHLDRLRSGPWLGAGLPQRWLDLVARDVNPVQGSLIIDVCCGTGRFSEPLAERFSARVLGLDPSEQMLNVAREKARSDRVKFCRSTAEWLPLALATADMVFISMVFHHLENSGAAVRECQRILRPGGHVCMRNTTRDADFPHRQFFPVIEAEFPARLHVEGVFAAAGFSIVAHEIVTQTAAATRPEFVSKIALRGYSAVARLSDKDFEAGMTALRSHVPVGGLGREVTEEVDWFVFQTL